MRNYKKEYERYHSKPEQKLRRAARNAARRSVTLNSQVLLSLPTPVLTTMVNQLSTLVMSDVQDFMKSVEEDMGTVTGPHIAGTGDDSSTVVVRKKKNAQVQKRQKKLLKDRIKDMAGNR